jgi:Glycosyltransferase family 87
LLVSIWIWALVSVGHVSDGPQARNFGGDFALNMSGAYAQQHGMNPYNGAALLIAEQRFLGHEGIQTKIDAATASLTWEGYPPLYFWLLRPLLGFSFRAVALTWIAALYFSLAIGFLAALKYLEWKHRVIPCLLFLAMPQATLEVYYANPTPLIFMMVMLALVLQRTRPFAAGLVFSLACIKPQLALLGFVMLALFHAADRRRFILGTASGVCFLLAANVAACGTGSVMEWFNGLVGVSSITGRQPNMAPLIGLYAGWVSATVRLLLEVSTLAVACLLTYFTWRRTRLQHEIPVFSVAWLWVVWFLALPYAHFADEIVLSIPILAMLGRDTRLLGRWTPSLLPYLMYFSALLFSASFHGAQLLSLPLLILLYPLVRAAHRTLAESRCSLRDSDNTKAQTALSLHV